MSPDLLKRPSLRNENANNDQELLKSSKGKCQWMAARKVDKLKAIVMTSVFVEMGGSWAKDAAAPSARTSVSNSRKCRLRPSPSNARVHPASSRRS